MTYALDGAPAPQGRPSRLHDRIRFTRPDPSSAQWTMERLQP